MKSERYQALVSANPDNELFRFSLAQALMEEGQETDAIPHFDVCLEKKPQWMMASILKGKCLLSLKETEAARCELQRALGLAIEQCHETPEAEIRKILNDL